MKDIIIVGAGDFGRELVTLIKAINRVEQKYNILGFINDIPNALDGIKIEYKIIGTIKDWQPKENEYFAMGIASPQGKEKVVNILKSKGAKFETFIHPAALLGDYIEFGEGCVVGGRSSVGSCTKVGNFVHIAGSMVGQDANIGDFSTTTGFANLTNSHIGKKVFIGSHAVVLNKLTVGDEAYISAGSIVVKNVNAGVRVFGYPAKKMDF